MNVSISSTGGIWTAHDLSFGAGWTRVMKEGIGCMNVKSRRLQASGFEGRLFID